MRASLHPQPGHFGIQGEFLYLRPTTTAFAFARERIVFTPENFTIKNLFNENRYQPGYRVEGVYALDCRNQLHARFTYFSSPSNPENASGIFVFPASFIGDVEDNNKFRYYAVEALFGRWLFEDCYYFDLQLQGGLLYSNIKFREDTRLSGPTIITTSRLLQSQFCGIGPEIALTMHYTLPFFSLVAISADARGSLLTSKTHTFSSGPEGAFTEDNEPIVGVVPSTDLRLGLSATPSCDTLCLNLEAGYEWIFYHRAFGISNLSFRGPYFVLSASF